MRSTVLVAMLPPVSDEAAILTPEGMFYADAVAGLLAAERAATLRNDNDATPHAMG